MTFPPRWTTAMSPHARYAAWHALYVERARHEMSEAHTDPGFHAMHLRLARVYARDARREYADMLRTRGE